jgi:hypothetical protein
VALVRTDISDEWIASIISVKRFSELRTTLAVTSNGKTLRLLSLSYSGHSSQRASVLITANVVLYSLILLNLMM